MKGLLLVDKPAGITSHDVVDRIRKASGLRRIGHTGTLDPGATGLLVLCLGPATRLSEHLTGLDKAYEGIMRMGIVTDSYDADGKIVSESPVPELTKESIQTVCDEFTGEIMQLPPMVSAVKVGGERLYKIARKGQVIEREARPVCVKEFNVIRYEAPDALIFVRCSRGTYVRSLCFDVGEKLGCGAHLASLRRTMVGPYDVDNALPVDAFTDSKIVRERLISMDTALDLPVVVVRAAGRKPLMSGNALSPIFLEGPIPCQEGYVQIKTMTGQLVAIGEVGQNAAGLCVHPKRVLVE